MLALFQALPIGEPISTAQLRYVTDNKDMRRVRELRTEFGWRIMTKNTGMPQLRRTSMFWSTQRPWNSTTETSIRKPSLLFSNVTRIAAKSAVGIQTSGSLVTRDNISNCITSIGTQKAAQTKKIIWPRCATCITEQFTH